jgi:hypothetical protein
MRGLEGGRNRSSKLKAQGSRSKIRRFLEDSKRLEDGEAIKEESKKVRGLEDGMKGLWPLEGSLRLLEVGGDECFASNLKPKATCRVVARRAKPEALLQQPEAISH